MHLPKLILLILILLFSSTGCQDSPTSDSNSSKSESGETSNQSFQKISPERSGVHFSNKIIEDYNYNIFNFEYLYNGGGVAVGDINNDGLPDMYFTGTFVSNKLYLNKGNFQFEDITEKAGVAATEGFKTGVTMADINGDGYLDIYVCRTSKNDDGKKNNHVFINNQDLTFTDRGNEFGLADNMNSNHATFFDYDLDGDLDLYLLNHRLDFTLAVKIDLQQDAVGNISRKTAPQSPFESDKLFRNDNGKFKDVSEQAGIFNSAFGLSATVADLNEDGYPDIFVANDYIEPDYVYINNRNGTFTDQYSKMIRHSSQNSMGSDIADINNDGLPDIIAMDMIADDPVRYKELMNVMQQKRYDALVKYGYGHQVGRNVLQLNNGKGGFSEIGHIAGISTTDWSWGPLLADLDNDGWKDVFIANGYKRDVTNMDYMTYTRDSIQQSGGITPARYPDINDFMKIVPSKKLANYCFKNNEGWTFEDVSKNWGFEEPTFSNGSAYGDLDADGDLDLVINNIDDPALIYQNNSTNNNLQLKLKGPSKNPMGFGSKAILTYENGKQEVVMQSSRGFFSASEPILHFGLGKADKIESLELIWPDGKSQSQSNVKVNQRLIWNYKDAKKKAKIAEKVSPTLANLGNRGINFKHQENDFQDFNRESLLPSQLSKLGPHISVSDVNGDKLHDLFVGGAAGQEAALFVQLKTGKFQSVSQTVFNTDAAKEDMGSLFFDADKDGDQDLFVVSGGSSFSANNQNYQDRLYMNDGKGNFVKASNFPGGSSAGSKAISFDYDQDGDLDLFVGGRCVPGSYPTTPKSFLFNNDGTGNFSDVSKSTGKNICNLGMISDVSAADLNGDNKSELILSGEWLPITIFSFDENKFVDRTKDYGLDKTNGWWNNISIGDIDGDGDKDIVAGNLGRNSRLKTSEENPIQLYAKDFDRNGQIDPIITFTHNGKVYPFAGRDAMVGQLAFVKKRYPRYAQYAKASLEEILGKEALQDARVFRANNFKSQLFLNDGSGKYTAIDLPKEAQVAPIMASLIYDFDGKDAPELFLTGNFSGAETESGVYDAFNGLVLRYVNEDWEVVDPKESGFWVPGEGRSIALLNRGQKNPLLVCTQNNGSLLTFERGQ